MELSEFQQKIYNFYLGALAEKQGRGYRARYNFDNLDISARITLGKLEQFFKQNNSVDPKAFFKAGFEYSVDNWLPLEHFKTRKAIAAYNKYIRTRSVADPDSSESLESFKEGLKFIASFSKENNVRIFQYKETKNGMGVPWFLIHLHEQRISFYHLHALDITLSDVPSDYKNLVFSKFDETFNTTLDKYLSSTRLKQIGNKLKIKIRELKEHN